MMADTHKVLGQNAPAATTLTDLYTVPSVTSAVTSTLSVCNRAASNATFRLSIAIGGAADTPAQYIYFDETVPANKTWMATVGFSLAVTDKVRVYASSSNLSFNLFGVEIT